MVFKIKTVRTTSIPDERRVMESMTRMRHDMGAHAKALWMVIGSVIVVAAVVGRKNNLYSGAGTRDV